MSNFIGPIFYGTCLLGGRTIHGHTDCGNGTEPYLKILQIHVRYTTSMTSGENSTIDSISEYLKVFAELDSLIVSMPKAGLSVLKGCRHLINQFIKLKKLRNISDFDLVFVHNQVPFLPSLLLSYLSRRALIVKVWHNQRPFCIKGSSFLNGAICARCTMSRLKKLNSTLNSCYRNSKFQTVLAELNQLRIVSILKSERIFHVTVSNFLRERLIQQGFNPERVHCIQNAVQELTLESRHGESRHGNDFVFMGRVCAEKGIDKLLEAWEFYKANFSGTEKLHVIGDGPLLSELKNDYADARTIFYGYLDQNEISQVMKDAHVGVIPNVWEEPFGKVALDFLKFGLRIVATRSGGLIEILSEDQATTFIDSPSMIELSTKMRESSLNHLEIDSTSRTIVLEKFNEKNIELQWQSLVSDLISKRVG